MVNLYIIQNIMIFMEECFVKLPNKDDIYTINPFYCKNENTFKTLQKDIEKLFPELRFIPYSNIHTYLWNKIYMSSYMPLEYQDTINILKTQEIILVEDGTFDYIDPAYQYDFYKGKKLYLFKPETASATAKKNAKVIKIKIDKEIFELFENLYYDQIKLLKNLPKDTAILFTTPLKEDFEIDADIQVKIIDFIKNKMRINRVILKRHPRDHFEYKTDKIEIKECPQNVPGQFIDNIFTGKKIYLFPSTVSFMSSDFNNIVFVNILSENKKYTEEFEKSYNKICKNMPEDNSGDGLIYTQM